MIPLVGYSIIRGSSRPLLRESISTVRVEASNFSPQENPEMRNNGKQILEKTDVFRRGNRPLLLTFECSSVCSWLVNGMGWNLVSPQKRLERKVQRNIL